MAAAVIYARVSSREQQQGYSIDTQLRQLREYASRKNYAIAEEFRDVETAKEPGRKRFGEMLAYFKRNRNLRTLLVEKTDRLYRNLRDAVSIEELDLEVHLVKEGHILSKDAPSQTKFMHGIQLEIARNYIENLREEVIKGMREKCEQGVLPGHAPFGYRNNKVARNVVPDSNDAPIVIRIFELYASGAHSLESLRKAIRIETGKTISKANLHLILKNRFYVGFFQWRGRTFEGKHETFISNDLFMRAQVALAGHNRPRYSKREIAFRGLMTCAYDGCNVTAEVKKEKYTYYRCTGYRGKCALPRFTEDQISNRLGGIFESIRIPDVVYEQISERLEAEENRILFESNAAKIRIEQRLAAVRGVMDRSYEDKLRGTIPEDFWLRKMTGWREEETELLVKLRAFEDSNVSERRLTAQKCLELANKAHCYTKRNLSLNRPNCCEWYF